MQRPRPVLTNAGIAGGLHGLALVLGFLGYSNAETKIDGETQGIVSVILLVVAVAVHAASALHAQTKVTPLESPRSNDGTTLVPITDILTAHELEQANAADAGAGQVSNYYATVGTSSSGLLAAQAAASENFQAAQAAAQPATGRHSAPEPPPVAPGAAPPRPPDASGPLS